MASLLDSSASLAASSASNGDSPDRGFAALTELVTRLFDLPIVLITAETTNEQSFHIWGKGRALLNQAGCTLPFSVPENIADDLFVIDDAQELSVAGEYPPELGSRLGSVRFVAHVPLDDPRGALRSHLWLMGPEPRPIDPPDAETLRHLGTLASNLLSSLSAREEPDSETGMIDEALDALSDSFFAFDEDGRLLYWNAQLNASTGYSDEEIATMRVSDFFEEADYERVVQAIRTVWNEGTATVEVPIRTRSGEKVPHEFSGSLLHDETGAVWGICGIGRDITERKRTMQALQESRARWQALVEHHPASIMIIGIDETIKYANASTATIYGAESPDEIIGRSIFDFLPDDYRPDIFNQREKLERGESTTPIRHPIRQLDGSKRIVESFSTPTTYNGEPAAQTVLRDVTEAERYERELHRAKETAEEMSRVKSSFLANMSHEIRTPLTSILGFSEVLADKVDDEEATELLRIITEGGQRLKETLNSVLDLAQLEGGTMEIEFEAVDVTERVREAERLFKPQAKEKGVAFAVDVPSDTPVRARLDRTALDRILSSLISNAIKFTKEGEISLQVEATPKEAILRVKDTGVGIEEDFMPHLFDEFKQESDGLEREFEGTGLGLTIAKRLVSLMHGSIEVDSEKGVGTTFTLRFPLLDPAKESTEAPTAPAPEPDPEPDAPADQRRILAVEDNSATRRLMARMLESDYVVDTAANATAALEHANQENYDAILLDINLSERRTGVEVLHEIRKLPRYDDTPIVACTAYALQNHAKRFLDAGFTSVIPKPFTKRSLLDGLDDAFDNPSPSPTTEELDLEDLELPPLPTTLPDVVDLIATGDTNPDLERLSDILKQDSIISFWLLRHANSAYYNLRNKISTVDRAVTFLGFRPVCNLVLTEVLAQHVGDTETPLAKEVQDYLIRTGLGAALYAKKVGNFLDVADPEVVYAGGMLSQLGRFLLLSKDPENYADLWTLTDEEVNDEEPPRIEPPPLGQEILHCGIDSVRLGAQVARTHHFADDLRTIIQFVHQPNQSLTPDRQILTLTTALSLQAAQDLHVHGGWDAFSDCRTRLDGSTLVQLTSLCEVPAEEVLYTIYEQQDDVMTFVETISRD